MHKTVEIGRETEAAMDDQRERESVVKDSKG